MEVHNYVPEADREEFLKHKYPRQLAIPKIAIIISIPVEKPCHKKGSCAI